MTNYDWNKVKDNDDEYQNRVMEQQERELARRCGMSAFEASNYTPSEMQARIQRTQQSAKPMAECYEGRKMVFVSYPQADGSNLTIWDADNEITPRGLRGINNHSQY